MGGQKSINGPSNSEWLASCCRCLEAAGARVYPFAASGVASGLPDRLVVASRWSGLIEFKGFGDDLRENQKLVIADCRARGFPVVVAHRVDVLRNLVNSHDVCVSFSFNDAVIELIAVSWICGKPTQEIGAMMLQRLSDVSYADKRFG